jgi:prophage regulatory protein
MRENSNPKITLHRCKSVLEQTGLKRSSLYKLISQGDFPKPVKITAKAVAWPSNEVEDWVSSRISANQQPMHGDGGQPGVTDKSAPKEGLQNPVIARSAATWRSISD